jgi:hypothetical protein
MEHGIWLCERSGMDGLVSLLVADRHLPKDGMFTAKFKPDATRMW